MDELAKYRRKYRHRRRAPTSFRIYALPLAVIGALGVAALFPETAQSFLSKPTSPPEAVIMAVCSSTSTQTCVVDGDTIRLRGERIRLLDIDAPEVSDYACESELARGRRATARLTEILNSGPITLRSSGRDRDQYGRALRIVEVNGRSAGSVLVVEGLARPWAGRRESWC